MNKPASNHQGTSDDFYTRSAAPFPILMIVVVAAMASGAKVHAVSPTDVFYGAGAGNNTTTGIYDTAIGNFALNQVTTGSTNTANGYIALSHNTTGSRNTASGSGALFKNS